MRDGDDVMSRIFSDKSFIFYCFSPFLMASDIIIVMRTCNEVVIGQQLVDAV